jgi:ribose 5-phosphate isomerase B
MKIALGSDHAGYPLKKEIIEWLERAGMSYYDFGCYSGTESSDYPDAALAVAKAVGDGEAIRGILVCATGIGMSIAANKVDGIRAAACHDCFSAHSTMEHNDSNILCLGARVIGPGLALDIVNVWLNTEFSNEARHCRRIDKIRQIESH